MKTRVTSFRLGVQLVEELDRRASFYGKNRNQLVQDILEQFVREEGASDNVVFEKGLRRDV